MVVHRVRRKGGGPPTSKRCPKTGYRGTVSYPGLVLNRDDTQPAAEELLHQIILFNIQRRSAQRSNSQRMIDLAPIGQPFHKRFIAGLLDALRNPFHGPIQRFDLPVIAIGRAIEHLCQTTGIDRILERSRPFRAQRPAIDGAVSIPFNVNHPAIFDIDVQTASYRAVRADAMYNLCIANAWSFFPAFITEWLYPRAYLQDLGDGGLY